MKYENVHFVDTLKNVWNYSLFTDDIIQLFQSGLLTNAQDFFGAKKITAVNTDGFYFSIWAPNAKMVSVVGDFNEWNTDTHQLFVRLDKSGIWEGFIPHIRKGSLYKFHITSTNNLTLYKADPYAIFSELRPATSSITWDFNFKWSDKKWMSNRHKKNALNAPWNIYELHLGSWMRPNKNDENSFNSYLQIAERLVPYIEEMGFTHVEFMPIMEFPYDKSWGYQTTGYFSATSRFGEPEDLMFLINKLHQHNIGVILDWVPSHFPGDAHGLYLFDGEHTYEYADMRKGFHKDWNSYIFNYKRGEVRSFLLSSAHFWLKYYHADGMRVDAVNSIIRLDFSRKKGEWEPNEIGTNENLEASDFIKILNKEIYTTFPDVQMFAEDASDWPGITNSIENGGYGFGMKWMMGWMHDTFKYFKYSPAERLKHQNKITFSMMYYFHEKFALTLSHDEVVHGKSPMIYKMPGNEKEKFANLRLLYGYMYTHPGAKLMFMGNEFGQTSEWNEASELDWQLLQYECHDKLKNYVRDLSHLYKQETALFELQFEQKGFEWVELNKKNDGILIFKRQSKIASNNLIVIMNMSNRNYMHWGMKLFYKEDWKEIFNSNDTKYWGSGECINDQIIQQNEKKHNSSEIIINIPALSILILR